jgi:hypothetical protein
VRADGGKTLHRGGSSKVIRFYKCLALAELRKKCAKQTMFLREFFHVTLPAIIKDNKKRRISCDMRLASSTLQALGHERIAFASRAFWGYLSTIKILIELFPIRLVLESSITTIIFLANE